MITRVKQNDLALPNDFVSKFGLIFWDHLGPHGLDDYSWMVLHHLVKKHLKNWDELLPQAELAFN